MLICKHRIIENGVVIKDEIKEVEQPLDEIMETKLTKLYRTAQAENIIKRCVTNEEIMQKIEEDLKEFRNKRVRKKKLKAKRYEFKYNIDLKNNTAHIYKYLDDKKYISVRDYSWQDKK